MNKQEENMDDTFVFTPEKVAETVKKMARLMNCDYETVWKKYTHPVVKDSVKWKNVKALLD